MGEVFLAHGKMVLKNNKIFDRSKYPLLPSKARTDFAEDPS